MIVVREVFQLHYGKAREAIALVKEMSRMGPSMGAKPPRLLTDQVGRYYTLIMEMEFESLAALEKAMSDETGVEAQHIVADAFQYVRQKHGPFDLLICDPPAFAKSRNEVERAARGYKDVNLYAMRMVAPGGLMMTFSCSGHMSLDLFQKVIFAAALDAGRRVSIVRRLTAGPDHPVSIYCPEGEYLKGFLMEIH